MNFLPSMLLATTLIGGSCNIRTNMSGLDMNSLQNLCKENSANCQVYVGNWCDLESILGCFRPSAPDKKGEPAACTGREDGISKGIRTPVPTVKGWCPRPLDDGDTSGGGKRDRTADLLHAMQALSQLSYSPVT